jgi:hypothetical protein
VSQVLAALHVTVAPDAAPLSSTSASGLVRVAPVALFQFGCVTTPAVSVDPIAAGLLPTKLIPIARVAMTTFKVTVTVKLFVLVLPAASVAVAVTLVVPTGKVLPDAGLKTTGTFPLTVSSADPEKLTTVPAGLVVFTVGTIGSVRTGGVVSRTVTVNDPEAVLFLWSVAVQLTVVVPSANVLHDSGLQRTHTSSSTLSVAVTEKATTSPAGPVASRVWLGGSCRTGGVASFKQDWQTCATAPTGRRSATSATAKKNLRITVTTRSLRG